MPTTHTARCLTNAGQILAEEAEIQGIEVAWIGDNEGGYETIPAWGMTAAQVVTEWLSNGTAACICTD